MQIHAHSQKKKNKKKIRLTSMKACFFLPVLLLFSLSFKAHLCRGSDTIFPGQSLSGNQTIRSDGGTFELGFFTPGNSRNYYIGIWYGRLPTKTVVWVANRNQPLSDPSSSTLQLSHEGKLVLLTQSRTEIWSTNVSSNIPNSTVSVLLDNGNLVVRGNSNSSSVAWQSFDHPTDTWLPGGRIGYSKLTNEKIFLTPWRNPENPAPGIFSIEVELNGTSHVLLWNHTKMYWSSGEWTGKNFVNAPEIERDYYIKNYRYVRTENESYFTYDAGVPTAFTRLLVDYTGQFKQFVWGKDFTQWTILWMRPTLQCEVYGFCGAFSSCNTQKEPLCECMQGFEPTMLKDWQLEDHSDGCVRETPLQCGNGGNDTFFVISNTAFPVDPEKLTVPKPEECEKTCLSNCSCTAYAYDNGCLIWKGALFNLQKLHADDEGGRDFHVRIAASELGETGTNATRAKTTREKVTWILIGTIGGFFLVFSIVLILLHRRQRRTFGPLGAGDNSLVLFKYKDLQSATKNFSEKLGEGAFGSVFKGTLPNSAAIAVKKLKNLMQEEKQFRTEVRSMGTIQHANLVRLRGFCAKASKRCLVFDYMPNGSLESHLFQRDSKTLDWKTRYSIAIGTARGLAYLHEKCRDCIIHCDIKPENILLDTEFNPKMADFGLAKLMGRDFSRVLTTMRGTIGYLAPEWLSGEAITPKADVFSYGMLLLEIISGRRNRNLLDDGTNDYYPIRAANTVNRGHNFLTLLDKRLEGNADMEDLTRACKVACWCIQDDEKDRPTMGQIVRVLEGVYEMGTPPIPCFFQQFFPRNTADSAIIYQEASSSSNSYLSMSLK